MDATHFVGLYEGTIFENGEPVTDEDQARAIGVKTGEVDVVEQSIDGVFLMRISFDAAEKLETLRYREWKVDNCSIQIEMP